MKIEHTLKPTIEDEIIIQMLKSIYPDNHIMHFETMSGGNTNINIKAELSGVKAPIVLRIYFKNPNDAYMEQQISHMLSHKVPTPKIYNVAQYKDYTFSIEEFITGITLNQFIEQNPEVDISPIMFELGVSIAALSKIKFSEVGFLDHNLKISHPITEGGFVNDTLNMLNSDSTKSILSSYQIQQLNILINSKGHLFPDNKEKNLVHGDLNLSNILVHESNNKVEIASILDWEFALSGSSMIDIANIMRCIRHMPPNLEKSLIDGLISNGYILPMEWKNMTHMINIFHALMRFKNANPIKFPNQINDIQELIQHIITEFNDEA